MNSQIFDSLKDGPASVLGPSRELNKLFVAKLEQLASLQLASLREYTDLNLTRLRAASEISSPEDLQDYLGKQQDFLKTVGEKMAGDAHAIATLGKEFTEEAQKIVLGGVAGMTKNQ